MQIINEDAVINSMRRNLIYLTKKDAQYILSKIDQDAIFKKHEPRVSLHVWQGEPINGVDVKNGRKRKRKTEVPLPNADLHGLKIEEYLDPADKFIVEGTGHAIVGEVDGRVTLFQPHVPGIQGYHALTSKTIAHPVKGVVPSACPSCNAEHDVEEYMEQMRIDMVKNLASSEIMTQVLYMAQEIYDKRMDVLSKISDNPEILDKIIGQS